jgi:hypothetical protein
MGRSTRLTSLTTMSRCRPEHRHGVARLDRVQKTRLVVVSSGKPTDMSMGRRPSASRLIIVGRRTLVCGILPAWLVWCARRPPRRTPGKRWRNERRSTMTVRRTSACVPPAPSSNLRNPAKLSKATSARADGARRLRSQINLWVRGGTPDLDNSCRRGP